MIKIIVKNCQKEEVQYLVPELVSLTGLTDEQRDNFNVMKALAEFTKLRVDKRITETNKIVLMLNKHKQYQLEHEKSQANLKDNSANRNQVEIMFTIEEKAS